MKLTEAAANMARECLHNALASVAYAEAEIRYSRRKLVLIREIAVRGDIELCLTAEEYVAALISETKYRIKFSEDSLLAAQATRASALILLDHLGIVVDLEAMEHIERERFAHR
jgi:hypothetical protein